MKSFCRICYGNTRKGMFKYFKNYMEKRKKPLAAHEQMIFYRMKMPWYSGACHASDLPRHKNIINNTHLIHQLRNSSLLFHFKCCLLLSFSIFGILSLSLASTQWRTNDWFNVNKSTMCKMCLPQNTHIPKLNDNFDHFAANAFFSLRSFICCCLCSKLCYAGIKKIFPIGAV